MWELDHKEGWAPKNWCFQIVVLDKTLENPLDCKEIKPVNPKGNQLWIFVGRTDAEAEALIVWPPNAKSWLVGKDLMLGKTEGKRKRGWQRMRRLDGIPDSLDINQSKLQEIVKDRGAWCAIYSLWGFWVGHNLTNEQQQLWIEEECSGEPLVGGRAGRFLEGGASGLWDLSFSLLLCNSYVISKYTHTLFFVVRKVCQATEHVCT